MFGLIYDLHICLINFACEEIKHRSILILNDVVSSDSRNISSHLAHTFFITDDCLKNNPAGGRLQIKSRDSARLIENIGTANSKNRPCDLEK